MTFRPHFRIGQTGTENLDVSPVANKEVAVGAVANPEAGIGRHPIAIRCDGVCTIAKRFELTSSSSGARKAEIIPSPSHRNDVGSRQTSRCGSRQEQRGATVGQ